MMRDRPHHPFQLAIETCWDQGHTARIFVRGELTEGGLPAAVVQAFEGQPIPLDLRPTDPLHPIFRATGVELTLSFGGFGTTCSIPWASVVIVLDVTTGAGFTKVVTRAEQSAHAPPAEAPAPREARPWAPRVLRGGKAGGPGAGSSGGSDSEEA